MTTLTAKQQLFKEQRDRIAAIIMEHMHAYSVYSSGKVIAECENKIPDDVTEETADGLRKQQTRSRRAKAAAHQIQLLMTGQIE